ncbi:hypothetical protein P7K49_014649, partial [Saguinus oedipus]
MCNSTTKIRVELHVERVLQRRTVFEDPSRTHHRRIRVAREDGEASLRKRLCPGRQEGESIGWVKEQGSLQLYWLMLRMKIIEGIIVDYALMKTLLWLRI